MASGIDPDALRAAREDAGLTQHQLARLVGAAGGERISRWELGTSTPHPDFLVRLAKALEVPAQLLIRLDGDVADLRALRLQAGLAAPDIAAAVNVAVPTYYAWEQGRWTRLACTRVARSARPRPRGVPGRWLVAALHEAQRQRRQRSETPSA